MGLVGLLVKFLTVNFQLFPPLECVDSHVDRVVLLASGLEQGKS